MLRKIVQIVPNSSKCSIRQCCWKPVGPVDPLVDITILKNGMRIATEQVDSPLACVSLVAAAGSRYETACNNGLTHFIEHMAYKGFKSLSQEKLEASMTSMAGRLTAQTSREKQIFSAIVPSQHALAAVDILYKIVTELSLSRAAMDQERDTIATEMFDIDNNPRKVVFDYLHATAYQGTPLGQSVIGNSENLSLFEPVSTAAFICEHYQPYRLVLATSGNVSHEQIMSVAEPRFGAITPHPCCEPEPGPNRYTGSSVVYRDDSMPFAHVAVAFEAPGYVSPDYLILMLMKNIIGKWDKSQGQHPGIAPLVARGVALEKTCERYEAFYIAYRDTGLFGTYFVAEGLKLDEVLFWIQEQWLRLCTIVRHPEVERGGNALRLEMAKRVTGCVRSSRDIGKQMLYTCGRRSLGEIMSQLDGLKVSTVRNAADRYLYDRCPVVAAVGPTEALPDYTRLRAGQWWLRL